MAASSSRRLVPLRDLGISKNLGDTLVDMDRMDNPKNRRLLRALTGKHYLSFRTAHTPGGLSLNFGESLDSPAKIKQILEEKYPQYGTVAALRIGYYTVWPNGISDTKIIWDESILGPIPRPLQLLVLFQRPEPETLDTSKHVNMFFESKAGRLMLEYVPLSFNVGQIKELIARKYNADPVAIHLGGRDAPNEANLALDFELQTYGHPRVDFAKDEIPEVKKVIAHSRLEKTTKNIMKEELKLEEKNKIHQLKRSNRLRRKIFKHLLELSNMATELRALHELSHGEMPLHAEDLALLQGLYEGVSARARLT